jgi:uncharacterized protein (TIGR02246 family)
MSAVDVVQRQLEAYNAQDLDAFCALYADDCIIADLNGVVTQNGKDALRARYTKTFGDYPKNRAWLVNRIAFGDTVVDHEKGERSPEGPFFEAVVIYTVKNGLIVRADFAK